MPTPDNTALYRQLLAETAGDASVIPWPNIDDRAAWKRLAATPPGSLYYEKSLESARRYVENPPLPPAYSQIVAYERTGERDAWQARYFAALNRLNVTVLAACFTNAPEQIDQAIDAIWALGEISNWVMPAHRREETDDSPGFDLGAAMAGQDIAEAVQIMRPALDRISPRFRLKIKRDLHERVFTPFLTRDYWFTYPHDNRPLNNWTAVCSGGALLAALAALDDEPELQAEVVNRAAWSLEFFVDVFGTSGSLDEGVGYWSYGMAYYTMAAERLYARTGGKVDLLAHSRWKDVARFPLRVNLYGDNYVNFSDCPVQVRVSPGWLGVLAEHLDLEDVRAWAARRYETVLSEGDMARGLPVTLRELVGQPRTAASPQPVERPTSTYLPDIHWFFARSTPDDAALILAAKGGHNQENHNHNDVGSFVVHYNGESLIDELGAPTYTRQFFGPDRYQNIAARSLGHSVPFVNGVEQRAGREFGGIVLEADESKFVLDLKAAYPAEARLVSLRRTLALVCTGVGTIQLTDEATFENEDAIFALPLVTLGKQIRVLEPGVAVIEGQRSLLRIAWNPEAAQARIESVETMDARFQDEHGQSKIRRLWFETQVGTEKRARLDLKITPVDLPAN